jgi:hypothetical protein
METVALSEVNIHLFNVVQHIPIAYTMEYSHYTCIFVKFKTLPGYDESPHSEIAPWTVATWIYRYDSKTISNFISSKKTKK